MVSRIGRNRRIVDASVESISSGLDHIEATEHIDDSDEVMVITCEADAPSKEEFLANPPEEMIFRREGWIETRCTLLENKEQWLVYLVDLTDTSNYNVLFIFKEPCDKQRHLSERRGLHSDWQIIPIDPTRSDYGGIRYRSDVTLIFFELLGFDIYADFSDG